MTDTVKGLQDLANQIAITEFGGDKWPANVATIAEAAEEIKRLREEMSKARSDAIEEAAGLVERLGTRKSLHIRIRGVLDENPGQIDDLGEMRVDELHQKIAAAIRAHSDTTFSE